MQLADNATRFQISTLLQSAHALHPVWSKCFYISCSSRKAVLALSHYCYSNVDVMWYWNVIRPHHTVWQDTTCICSSPDPSSFAKVGLACGSSMRLGANQDVLSVRHFVECAHFIEGIFKCIICNIKHTVILYSGTQFVIILLMHT